MHRSISFLYANITALAARCTKKYKVSSNEIVIVKLDHTEKDNKPCSAILEKYGKITRLVNTSLIPYLYANPSMVSTKISLMAEMLIVITNSHTRPILKVRWAICKDIER